MIVHTSIPDGEAPPFFIHSSRAPIMFGPHVILSEMVMPSKPTRPEVMPLPVLQVATMPSPIPGLAVGIVFSGVVAEGDPLPALAFIHDPDSAALTMLSVRWLRDKNYKPMTMPQMVAMAKAQGVDHKTRALIITSEADRAYETLDAAHALLTASVKAISYVDQPTDAQFEVIEDMKEVMK